MNFRVITKNQVVNYATQFLTKSILQAMVFIETDRQRESKES